MLPWSADLSGRIDKQTITSQLLKDNPLGDPYERPLWVYLPPGYDAEPDRRYPSVYVIQGYTGHLAMWANRSPYRQPFTETADALFAAGEAPRGPLTAAASSSTRRAPGATTPTSATRWFPGSTRGTGRSATPATGPSWASRAAASAR
jgi:hypothetical protein